MSDDKIPPRIVPNRDDRYMGLAFWIASFSKDPNTQVGCIIVSEDNRPLGFGYNGAPRGIDDDDIDWSRPNKYPYIIHAEENAILHCKADPALQNATLYVTAKPCGPCMIRIIQAKIPNIVYFPYKPKDAKSILSGTNDFTDELADKANITLSVFEGNLNWMKDRISIMEELCVFKK